MNSYSHSLLDDCKCTHLRLVSQYDQVCRKYVADESSSVDSQTPLMQAKTFHLHIVNRYSGPSSTPVIKGEAVVDPSLAWINTTFHPSMPTLAQQPSRQMREEKYQNLSKTVSIHHLLHQAVIPFHHCIVVGCEADDCYAVV